jgi:hypothetical protein
MLLARADEVILRNVLGDVGRATSLHRPKSAATLAFWPPPKGRAMRCTVVGLHRIWPP